MQCFAASGLNQVFDKSQTSQRQVSDKMSTQKSRKPGRRPGFRQDRCNGIWPLACRLLVRRTGMVIEQWSNNIIIKTKGNIEYCHLNDNERKEH